MDCNKYISLEDQIIDSEYLASSCSLKHMSESLCTDYTSVLLDVCEQDEAAYWVYFYGILIVTHLSDEEIEFHRGEGICPRPSGKGPYGIWANFCLISKCVLVTTACDMLISGLYRSAIFKAKFIYFVVKY